MPLTDYADPSNTLTAGARYSVARCANCGDRFEPEPFVEYPDLCGDCAYDAAQEAEAILRWDNEGLGEDR